jgi:hypothetical protein
VSVSVAGVAPMVRLDGLNLAVELIGRPATENVLCPVNPKIPVSVIWNCADCPDVTVTGVAPEPATGTMLNVGVPIVSVTEFDVLPRKFPVAEYTAVIVCAPPASVEMVKLAEPRLSVAAPRSVAPSKKETLPAGTPVVDDTVDVKVTFAPGLDKLADVSNALIVVAELTVRLTLAVADVYVAVFVGVKVTYNVWLPAPSTVPESGA